MPSEKPVRKPRPHLLTMNQRALDLIKARWFLRGIAETGDGFNGETLPVNNKGARRMLLRRFKLLLDRDGG